MRFKLQGRTYQATAVFDRVPLRDLLALEVELETLGRPMKWSEVRALVYRISQLDDAQDDPDFLWFLGLLVWGTRRIAGEQLTFEESIDFPLGELEVLPEPEDRKGSKKPDPRRARAGSARAAGKRRKAAGRAATRTTSETE